MDLRSVQWIATVRTYCYLGIHFSLNGSFKRAINELRKKALRAFFSIRRIVDTRALTTSSMLKLIDSLVKPVATYGCPVWLPWTNSVKALVPQPKELSLPKAASKDMLETTHLKMLKWVLGVHKKTNNNACYGDTGRMPWSVSIVPQCVDYFQRTSQAVTGNVNTLLHHTFAEQKRLDLTWYRTWQGIISNNPSNAPPSRQSLTDQLRDRFITDWKSELQQQRKMAFYRAVKCEFGEEEYLKLDIRSSRVNIAKLRSSSHDLWSEKGRYTSNRYNTALKACRFCCSEDRDTLVFLEQLPFFEEPFIESEEHVLTECPGYHNIRLKLSENLKSLLMLKEYSLIMNSPHLPEFGKYLTDSFHVRNPHRKRNLT